MKNLTRALHELVEWHPVGVALGIPHHKLDAINISQHRIPLCKVIIVCLFFSVSQTRVVYNTYGFLRATHLCTSEAYTFAVCNLSCRSGNIVWCQPRCLAE